MPIESCLLQAVAATPLRRSTEALPALPILSLALSVRLAVRLTGATLHAIDAVPLLQGLDRQALRGLQREQLLARIEFLRQQWLV